MSIKVKKVTWSDEEDRILLELIQKFQEKQWSKIADELFRICRCRRKTGRQCRQRWHNQLNPKIVRKEWSMMEQDILFEEHQRHGSKWSIIAEKLEGRSQNNIKNHFYSTIRKILRRITKYMGSKDGTVKIKKIKPTALSKIFSLTESSISLKPDENTPVAAKAHADQQRKKQMIYKIINQSRQKISQNKLQVNQQEIQLLEKLLSQVQKTNQQYKKEKNYEIMVKREKNLQKNFDHYAESSQNSCISQFSQNKKKKRQINQRKNKNIKIVQEKNQGQKQRLNQSNNSQNDDDLLHHFRKNDILNNNFRSQRLNERQSSHISKCYRQMIIFQRQSSHLSRLEQMIIQGENTDNSNPQNIVIQGFDFNIEIQEDHVIDQHNIQKCLRMSPASPAFDYFRIKRFQRFVDGEENNQGRLTQFNKVIQQKVEQQEQFQLQNSLL